MKVSLLYYVESCYVWSKKRRFEFVSIIGNGGHKLKLMMEECSFKTTLREQYLAVAIMW